MSYEFSEQEGKVIHSVGVKAVIIGAMLIIAGFFGFITAFLNTADFGVSKSIILGLEAMLVIIIGIFLIKPSDNFKRVAKTEGNDIGELMTGLNELSIGFKIIVIMLATIIVLDLGIMIIGD